MESGTLLTRRALCARARMGRDIMAKENLKWKL